MIAHEKIKEKIHNLRKKQELEDENEFLRGYVHTKLLMDNISVSEIKACYRRMRENNKSMR